ncbi:MAG: hypothetical protein QM817_12075 [Archangium sp.]
MRRLPLCGWSFVVFLLAVPVLSGCNCQRQRSEVTLLGEGERCNADSECESSLCDAVNGNEAVCLRPCLFGCRETEICTTLDGDRKACVQEREGLCRACTQDSDCPQKADKCILVGGVGVCGRDCSYGDVCPPSYRCDDSASIDGGSAPKQCVPTTNDCECTNRSAGQTRPCSIANDAGTCVGIAVCAPPSGYSSCNARTPVVEACNGLDDDCNGANDDSIPDIACGVGACLRTVTACVAGVVQTCTPGLPSAETCNGIDDDCNGITDDPAFTATDPANCGTCSFVCSLPHAVEGCAASVCTVDRCDTGYANCDNAAPNGCEVDLSNDVNHCSGCGNACSAPHAVPRCSSGTCQYTCDANYYDIDLQAANGCEYLCIFRGVELCNGVDDDCDGAIDEAFNLQSDPANCGACNVVCNLPHANPVCSSGSCAVGTCATGWKNCNNVTLDGCETNIFDDTSNCGNCGLQCNVSGGQAACSGGTCGISCGPGFADCNSNASDGCERNVFSDIANCGGCNVACLSANATPLCTGGACRIGACNPGFADCNANPADGCEVNLNADPTHCGSCTTACVGTNGTATCSGGMCGIACLPGFSNCDGNLANGCEVNLSNDPSHCGTCSTVCNSTNGTGVCVLGSCGINCNSGFANCNGLASDGCEINIGNNTAHCGGCNQPCSVASGTAACSGGMCGVASCNSGFANCNMSYPDGCEVNTTNNPANCGACNAACTPANGVGGCAGSMCNIASCNGTQRDCNLIYADGCEVNVATNTNNCGACGNVCSLPNATPTCSGSSCQVQSCNANFGNCNGVAADGCEVNLTNTVAHCGACNAGCAATANVATPSCSGSNCGIAACVGGFANCNGAYADGCEIQISTNVNHCGACNNVCPTPNNATATCPGTCSYACNPQYYDLDLSGTNGCEYLCNVASPTSVDVPDENFLDSNCDGLDGIESQSVFVATNGSNGAGCGTRASPCQTIQRGIDVAGGSRPHVLVSEGNYFEQVTLKNGVNVFGGYSRNANWARSASYIVLVQNDAVIDNKIITITGSDLTASTSLEFLTVRTGAAPAGNTSVSTYAINCFNCDALTLRRINAQAGAAGAGATGGTGGIGGNGNVGSNVTVVNAGGNGGPQSSCATVFNGSAGGRGGNGGNAGSNSGQVGFAGYTAAGFLVSPSNGGPQGNHNGCNNANAGQPGQMGATGGVGGIGSGSSSLLGFDARYLTSSGTGAQGGTGVAGNGGGGGGGGGAQGGSFCSDRAGAGGGGGGSGGCGGAGGFGGVGGGGSFAVFLANCDGVVIDGSVLTSGTGGAGGNGGSGGGGGTGGTGGTSFDPSGEPAAGGSGGQGGFGGQGGQGGGGAGGPSYALYKLNSTSVTVTASTTLVAGSGGVGGNSGQGATGVSAQSN